MARVARKITQFQSKKEIDALFKRARCAVKHPGLFILIAPAQSDIGRILIIASRKVGNAPQRNKIRRRLKSIFYEEKLYEKGFDCIVIVKKEGTQLPFETLRELLLDTFAKQSAHPSSS